MAAWATSDWAAQSPDASISLAGLIDVHPLT
jgi:hypothetical protein